MGKLLDYLIAASGERSLHGRLGLWRRMIAEALDAIVTPGTAELLQVSRSGSDQVGVTSGTDIVLNNVVAQRDIPYSTATGVATLTAGKTYRLGFHATFANFSAPATNSLTVQWVNGATNTPLNSTVRGSFLPVTSTADSESPGKTVVYFTPTAAEAAQGVKLRCTASGGTADLLQNLAQAEILQV